MNRESLPAIRPRTEWLEAVQVIMDVFREAVNGGARLMVVLSYPITEPGPEIGETGTPARPDRADPPSSRNAGPGSQSP